MELHEYVKWGLHWYGKHDMPEFNIDISPLKYYDAISKAM
jgi:hypothetical protein